MLEERFGVPLLARSTRQVRATEAGLVLYERAIKVLAALDEAQEEVARSAAGQTGCLRVAGSLAYGRHYLLPAARAFLERHPNVRVQVLVNDRYVDLVGEGVDVAVRVGELEDSTLQARRLGHEELVLVAAPQVLRGARKHETLEDLAACEAVVLLRRGGRSVWTFRPRERSTSKVPETQTVTLHGRLELDSIVAVRDALVQGMGIGVVPLFLARDDLAAGRLVELLPSMEIVGLPVHAVYPPARRLPTKVQSFVTALAEIFAKPTHSSGE